MLFLLFCGALAFPQTCVDDEAKVREDAFDPLATCANMIEAYKVYGVDLCAPDSTFRETCCATCKKQSTDATEEAVARDRKKPCMACRTTACRRNCFNTEQSVGTHEFGTKATAPIPCSDANINNEGCWDCYANNGAACLAKQWGRTGLVAGVCTGSDEEYWNYKCVSGMENEVGGIIHSSCPNLSCSQCVNRQGCTFADRVCWDSRYIPMGTKFFVRNAADCPKPKAARTYSSQEDSAYDFEEDAIETEEAVARDRKKPCMACRTSACRRNCFNTEQSVGTHEFGTKATAPIPCSDANINNEGCWDCYANNGAACLAKQWGRTGLVAGVCTGSDAEYWNYKCVSGEAGEAENALSEYPPWWFGKQPEGEFVALAPKSSISVNDFVTYGFALLGLGTLLFQGVKTCRKQDYAELVGSEEISV